ncbi:hypothetical protein KW843_10030 [Acidovorax sp. sif1233]|uniref:hypothetical protein n=1 Tax=Acidovorax sp. sif1233 TaxID=2854792 RepID=UPI001C487171|nr:hypothetical protein [Acidovorax sp. sif1233]MBV7454808.1 hypothetical protein [Acidovorax sp. sif1233]
MNESVASSKADAMLLAILTNQPEVLYKGTMTDISNAEQTAEALAAFRRRLIVKLMEQAT